MKEPEGTLDYKDNENLKGRTLWIGPYKTGPLDYLNNEYLKGRTLWIGPYKTAPLYYKIMNTWEQGPS